MAARVSIADVQKIYTEKAGQDLDVFITQANLLVNQVLSESGLSEAILTEIERYVAADFATVGNPMAADVSMGGLSVRNEGSSRGAAHGRYWDIATKLDTTGALAELTIAADKSTAKLAFVPT